MVVLTLPSKDCADCSECSVVLSLGPRAFPCGDERWLVLPFSKATLSTLGHPSRVVGRELAACPKDRHQHRGKAPWEWLE